MSLQDKINEIWREPPEIDFPECLIEKLDLDKMKSDFQTKADSLRDRLAQRKEEEEKKKLDME